MEGCPAKGPQSRRTVEVRDWLRTDFDAQTVRSIAERLMDRPQARRLLAVAAIFDGATRTEAAKIGGVTAQTSRLDDEVQRVRAGRPDRLLAAPIHRGADPEVVRWRIAELRAIVPGVAVLRLA